MKTFFFCIICITFGWYLIDQTLCRIANILGNAFLDEVKKMNKSLDYIAGFLEEIRDKLNNN